MVVIIPLQSYIGWKVAISLVHGVTIACSLYRLIHRVRIHRFWLDDYLVCIPLLLNILCCLLAWLRINHGALNLKGGSQTYEFLSSYWLSCLPYLGTMWASRIVVTLSLGRLFPPKHPARRWSICLLVIVVLCFIGNVLVAALFCKYPNLLMIIYEAKECATTEGGFLVAIAFQVIASILCDILLIISPLVIFWRVRLSRLKRRLVLLVFCGNILTLLSAIVFAVVFLSSWISAGPDVLIVLVGLYNIEAAIGLFACNFTVISTCFYQALRRLHRRTNSHRESGDETTSSSSAPRPCTCVSEDSPLSGLTEFSTFDSESSFRESPPSAHRNFASLNLNK